MKQHRNEAAILQRAIRTFIVERNIRSDVALAGIGEFLIHYSVSTHGTNFTAVLLEKCTSALDAVEESIALIPIGDEEL